MNWVFYFNTKKRKHLELMLKTTIIFGAFCGFIKIEGLSFVLIGDNGFGDGSESEVGII